MVVLGILKLELKPGPVGQRAKTIELFFGAVAGLETSGPESGALQITRVR